MAETLDSEIVYTRRQRIATLARRNPKMGFTSLNHHLDLAWLREAYRRTRKDGASGVDGQTAADYEANLEEDLRSLLERAKSGTYHAPPVRRTYIPKGTKGDLRPLGIPTFEDKVLQRAVAMVLEAVYEQDFYACSYGFRPGRSAHQALEALWKRAMDWGGGWVLDVDIRKFFDTLDHAHLRELLQRRVRDGVLMRLIGKWLNAGVLEDGALTYPEEGTLDEWFEQEVKPRLKSRAYVVRYADDFVAVFEREDDAQRVLAVLPKRFGRYGLALHPEKTRLVAFRNPGRPPQGGSGPGPGTFDLLGFTHYWAKSWTGRWVVKRKTAKSRLMGALQRTAEWCRLNRHRPIPEQHVTLSQKLRGHYAYYGITGNSHALGRFFRAVGRAWRLWLGRRKRDGRVGWDWFNRLLRCYPLPPPVAIHSVGRPAANP
jgi:RNA-directed DNA polymerase